MMERTPQGPSSVEAAAAQASSSVEEAPRRCSKTTRALSKLCSIFSSCNSCMSNAIHVTGTLFGHPSGHVRLAFQDDPRSPPASLIELGMQTVALVKDMATRPLRFEFECDKTPELRPAPLLMDEPRWRMQINELRGRDALRRQCTAVDLKVLRAIEPVSVGAGMMNVEDGGAEEEVMYVRVRFEREVKSRHSEVYRMVGPSRDVDRAELSCSFLRV